MPQGMTRPPADVRLSPLQRSLQRRRRVLAALVVTVLAAFLVAVVASEAMFWAVHLIADAVLITYLGVLIHLRNTAADDEMTRRALSA